MSEEQPNMVAGTVDGHGGHNRRTVKRKGKSVGRSTSGEPRGGAVQLSVSVPRDVMATYESAADNLGVVRSQLLREAIELYAALLESGQRTYRHPGWRRVA